MPVELTTTQDLRPGTLSLAGFNELALRDGLTQVRRRSFPVATAAPVDLSALGTLLVYEEAQFTAGQLVRAEDGVLIALQWSRGQAELAVAGTDAADVDEIVTSLEERLRDVDGDPTGVAVTFWAGGTVPASPRRRIDAPRWAEIERNYATSTRDALAPLMAAREPGEGGLLLWHGAPGTGKSYALRALAREWVSWCDTWFISDPEVFLGAQTSYLLQALLRTDPRERHRLIVLEDAGELLAADARAQTGQALSRLLNLTDGLLGVGLRAIVLVTTNEPVRKLHPAVVRPGRCWAEVDFAPLPVEEASAWLETPVDRSTTIAELFALRAGERLKDMPCTGFGK